MQQKISPKGMDSHKSKKPVTKQKKEFTFPLEKQNIMIICAGIVVIIIGYFLMSQNSVDGFLPTVVAPIVLLFGYCVIIPYGILKKAKKSGQTVTAGTEQLVQPNVTAASVSSNIKTG